MSPQRAVGVDVGGTRTRGALVDASGRILLRVEHPTDPEAGTKGIIAAVEELLARAAALDMAADAVGVGAAGFVDAKEGAVIFSPNLSYDDPQIRDALEARVDLPVVVDNDANAAAWGERTFGVASGCRHLALLTIGTGIGSGFVVDGRLVRGSTGAAAELGHIVVDIDGPQCNCGLKGCLEQTASGTAIARMAREALDVDPSSSILAFAGSVGSVRAEHVARAAREYDPTARSVLRRAGQALGIGLSNVVNIFDPEAIVLAGGAVGAGEAFLGAARDRLAAMTHAQRRRPMRLDVSALGGDLGMLGAAALALEESR